MCLSIHNKKRTFGQKDCTIWEMREVHERSGIFMCFITLVSELLDLWVFLGSFPPGLWWSSKKNAGNCFMHMVYSIIWSDVGSSAPAGSDTPHGLPAYRSPPPYSEIEQSRFPTQNLQTVPKTAYTPAPVMPTSPQLASQPPSYTATGRKQKISLFLSFMWVNILTMVRLC